MPQSKRVNTVLSGTEKQMKRLHLVLPEELYSELERLADQRHTTVTALLRSFIKLGLLAVKVDESPDQALIVRDGDHEQRLLLF
jgi:hypothetical protein